MMKISSAKVCPDISVFIMNDKKILQIAYLSLNFIYIRIVVFFFRCSTRSPLITAKSKYYVYHNLKITSFGFKTKSICQLGVGLVLVVWQCKLECCVGLRVNDEDLESNFESYW